MRVIILMAGIAFGLYFIIADRLKIPYLKASKAIMNMGRKDRRLTTVIEAVIMDLSIKLSRYVQKKQTCGNAESSRNKYDSGMLSGARNHKGIGSRTFDTAVSFNISAYFGGCGCACGACVL